MVVQVVVGGHTFGSFEQRMVHVQKGGPEGPATP